MSEETKSPEALQLEAAVRREVQKQLQGKLSGGEYRADEYDFKVESINVYPGAGWTLHEVVAMGAQMIVFGVWRMSRAEQVSRGIKPIIALT